MRAKLFRIRGNGVILFDRIWLYAFRRSLPPFSMAVHVGGGEWRIATPLVEVAR